MAERQSRSRLQDKESAVSDGYDLSKALQHRRHAAACGLFAASARSAADRELLLCMQRSSLERAWRADWLGKLPPTPPVQVIALTPPRRWPGLRSVGPATDAGGRHGRL
jgi:hypothetical protein